ncbi:tetratricopeptide repeat protein [Massilia endophytica]|uniref:tetratricopeptide repeat protein n=1 Tax=Massilia endophytica TaxID=2899220 RepID=UPI001E4DA144|nr:tetratricopeptide repeat protein [Massilia endophytica]UGQ47306.1 tetratricopeptide repeat protein [Massilia endophytica]
MSIPSQTHAQAEALFAQGLQFHSQGELPKAMQTYEQVLKLEPKHFGALHHVGVIGFQIGNFDMAANFIRSAVAVNPDDASAHSNLGNALREQQNFDEALRCYERAIQLNGGDADTFFNRGAALQALQRTEEALRSYEQALAINAGDDQAWNNRATVLLQMKDYAAALESAEQALSCNPQNGEAYNNSGKILHAMGRLDEAEKNYRQALELFPDYADAHLGLGRLLLSRERFADALHSCDKAVSLAPDQADAYEERATVLDKLNRPGDAQRDRKTAEKLKREAIAAYRKLGKELQELDRPESAARMFAALLALDDSDADIWQQHARTLNAAGRREEALASIGRALALKPDSADYHLTRGAILRASLRYGEAQRCYEKAVELAPRHPGGYTNLGSLLDQIGQQDAALANYDRAIALDPQCALAHWNRALVYLRQGDYERGWRGYEWRWKAETLSLAKKKRDFGKPMWTGREALAGKTILVHAEQGLGDALQFCRYVPLLAQRGAKVVLEVKEPLAALLATLEGAASIVIKGEPLPPFDYQIPIMSLPLAFGTTLDTVPGAPYLASSESKLAQWSDVLGPKTKPRVGIVWAGHPGHQNDHNRSLPLSVFVRIFSDGCEFVSLQKEVRAAEQPLLDTLPVRQVSHLLKDFTDTAALCSLMDVVITVDTSVAHLAGALGRPTWILLPTPFEWRWLEQGAGSPWYPSAVLYRQSQQGHWEPVIDAVAGELGKPARG